MPAPESVLLADDRALDATWWRQAVVYQVYPRSFADSDGDGLGDIPGVTSRIGYLAELGIDAIWLSPFYPSALADGGYDVDDYRDVAPELGTLTDFDALVGAAYGSAGERCMAISVVLAMDVVADELVAKITDRIGDIKVGPGTDPANEMGPLITGEHRDKVAGYVTGAAEQGATVVVDGTTDLPADGFFLNPSLLDHVEPGMASYDDEIFGPVLGVARVATYEEAVRLVNENPYGNGAALFTRDGGAARRFQHEVEAGMVGINVPIPVPVAYYSFGGWKASLFGSSHVYGPEGVAFYTRAKVVTSRWPDPATSEVELGFPQNR